MPDLKRVKAAAASRTKKTGKNYHTQYVLWIGGSIGSVIIAGIVLIINPDKGPFQIVVNDRNLIMHFNRNAKGWTAGPSSFFDGWTIGDVKLLDGVGVSQLGANVPACMVPEATVPASFDARTKWPACFRADIYNMGNCTASWAIATTSALSNRFCISDPDAYGKAMLSPQQLLSCDQNNRGCRGGSIDSVFLHIEKEGLVSEDCFPYEADSTVGCKSHCKGEGLRKAASHCMLSGEVAIRREILLNGPVVGLIFLLDDFLVYRGGLYQETPTSLQLTGMGKRGNRLVHAVKILGWGEMEGKPYWLLENSWGKDWGERGFAKVVRGGNPEKKESIVLETFMVAGTPASTKIGEDAEFDTYEEEHPADDVRSDTFSEAEEEDDDDV